jgi:hypothetical protein
VYTIIVTPSADGPVTIDIPSAVAQDSFGNNNTAATQISRTYDGTDPSVVLTTTASASTNAGFIVLATFSESVTGVTVSDFLVTNGTKTAFTKLSGTGYSVMVTGSSQGIVTVNF